MHTEYQSSLEHKQPRCQGYTHNFSVYRRYSIILGITTVSSQTKQTVEKSIHAGKCPKGTPSKQVHPQKYVYGTPRSLKFSQQLLQIVNKTALSRVYASYIRVPPIFHHSALITVIFGKRQWVNYASRKFVN